MATFKNGIVDFNKQTANKPPKRYKVKYRETVEHAVPKTNKPTTVSNRDIKTKAKETEVFVVTEKEDLLVIDTVESLTKTEEETEENSEKLEEIIEVPDLNDLEDIEKFTDEEEPVILSVETIPDNICSICGFEAKNARGLSVHMRRHSDKD